MLDLAGIFIMAFGYFGTICADCIFCKRFLEISRVNEKRFVLLAFSCGELVNVASQNVLVPYIFFAALSRVFFIGLVLLLFEGNAEKKILAASMLIAATVLTKNFCESFFSCLELFWLHAAGRVAVPVLGERGGSLIVCTCMVIVMLVVIWMSKHSASVFYCKPGKWQAALALPLLVVTMAVDVANWGACNGILVKSGGMGLYYDQLFSYAGFCALTALSMCAAGFYVWGMERIYTEQEKSARYHSQIETYQMLEEQYGRSERLRHDLKNHVISLRGLLEKKEWEKMEGYLKNMEGGAGLEMEGEITGNRAVDALLHQKRKMAERKNILWECDAQIPKTCSVNEFDLCVLFGNILDNAVEACEKIQCDETHCLRRFVDIQARVVKKCLLLEVKNSMDMADWKGGGCSSKKSEPGHGIGLLNIRDVARKYNGAMNMEARDGVFVISVLVPLDDEHDKKQAV